jgi:hypothetical protein
MIVIVSICLIFSVNMLSFVQSHAMEGQQEQLFLVPAFPNVPSLDSIDQPPNLVCREGSCEEKLEKLHILSNLLLAAHEVHKGIYGIMPFDAAVVETSDVADIKGFYVVSEKSEHREKGKEEIIKKDGSFQVMASAEECEILGNVGIKSEKGKAIYWKLLPLLNPENCNEKTYKTNESLLNDFIQDSDSDVALIARYVKSSLCQTMRKNRLIMLADALFYPLTCLKTIGDPREWPSLGELYKKIPQNEYLLGSEHFNEILDSWLERKGMASLVESTVPHVRWSYQFVNGLMAYIICDRKQDYLSKSQNESLSGSLKHALAHLEETHDYSENLYKKIMQMRAHVLLTIKKPRKKSDLIKKYSRLFLLGSSGQADFGLIPQSLGRIKSEYHQDETIQTEKKKNTKKKDNKKK